MKQADVDTMIAGYEQKVREQREWWERAQQAQREHEYRMEDLHMQAAAQAERMRCVMYLAFNPNLSAKQFEQLAGQILNSAM